MTYREVPPAKTSTLSPDFSYPRLRLALPCCQCRACGRSEGGLLGVALGAVRVGFGAADWRRWLHGHGVEGPSGLLVVQDGR